MPRCRECTYVPDADEWICAVCGGAAAPGLAAALSRSLRALGLVPPDDRLGVMGLEDEPDDFDDDELGVDTEFPEDR